MKIISLFSLSIFAMGISLAQSIDDFSFVPPITDNNMSVVFPAGTLSDYVGGSVQSYVGGVAVSSSFEIQDDGASGSAVIGSDSFIAGLALSGNEVSFAILINTETIVIVDVNPPVIYSPNSFQLLIAENLTFTIDGYAVVFGCTDIEADNYDSTVTEDDGSCTYTILGCTDSDALNYNSFATIDDGSCEYEQTGGGDCILPSPFAGNTGANMTVMLLTDFVSSLNVTDPNAYMVALSSDGLVVGSTSLFGASQTSLAVWGDDSQTPEIDGALANEAISFQLVNGTDLYNVEMPLTVTYVTNSLVVQTTAANLSSVNCVYGCAEYWADNYDELATVDDGSCFKLGCMNSTADNYNTTVTEDDGSCTYTILGCTSDWADNYDVFATENDGSCSKLGCTSEWADNFDPFATNSSSEIPNLFEGNTGANMSVMFMPAFVSSLNITEENAYIVALTLDGLVVGSEDLFGISQTSIAIWGNDPLTPEIDGALANELISFQLVNGTDLYNVEMPSVVNYTTNVLAAQTAAGVLILAGDDCTRLGCTSNWADNYDALATDDDESCSKLGCTEYWADNFDALATDNDESCSKLGCTSDWADNYDVLATENDGSCFKLGCTSDWADNYDVLATENDGSCSKVGCTEDWADNFDPNATNSSSQIPEHFYGNTGVNMTTLLTEPFINSLNITEENAYIVALNTNGLVVGSAALFGVSQTSLAIWGDDSITPEIDGALANEFISFQLVNGTDLYNVESPLTINYTTNGLSFQTSSVILTSATGDDCIRLGCTADWADNYDVLATDNDESCSKLGCTEEWADNYDPFATNLSSETPNIFEGNTGVNMTLMLLPDFINSLNITNENAYIVASVSSGLVVGSANLYGLSQSSMAIWGDDTSTPEIDGALTNESISFQLVNGIAVYDVEMPTPVTCIMNVVIPQFSSAILTLATGDDCVRFGCTSGWADNFDELATENDGSCSKLGCTSDWADNYDTLATEDDESCSKLGCTSDWADNYEVLATENDGSCSKLGCTEDWADNYDILATDNDGSCFKVGCTEDWADNFDPFATISSSETPNIFEGNTGINMTLMLLPEFINSLNITNENAYIVASVSSGLVVGSANLYGLSQSSMAIWGDDTSTPEIDGALTNESISFQLVNGIAVYDVEMPTPVTCIMNVVIPQFSSAILILVTGDDCVRFGCTSGWADNFDELATENDGSCSKLGCTSDWADNYDTLATEDDESCSKLGCTSDWADNYEVLATEDDDSCYKVGCQDVLDCNFDALATIEDGSCVGQPGCLDHFYFEYNPLAGCSLENACQTSWIQLYDSIQVEYNDLDISYNIESQELSNTILILDSLQVEYNDLDISYNIESQELSNTILTLDSLQVEYNTITTLYIDSISQITQSYNSLDEECTQGMIQSAFAIDSLNYMNGSYIDSINQITINYNSLEEESTEDMLQSGLTIDSLNYMNGSLSEEVEYWSSSILIDLIAGWNIIGYTSKEPQDVVATLQGIEDIILIVKNNAAEVYWPEFGFNGIGDFIPGQGYQIKVSEGSIGFTYPDVGGERIELTPTVPQWAIDMEVEMHPNDIRTLVRVVNMLGQEVNPATQFNGEVLLYLYNDGTVEKKIVE